LQRDHDALVGRKIDTRDTSHVIAPVAGLGRPFSPLPVQQRERETPRRSRPSARAGIVVVLMQNGCRVLKDSKLDPSTSSGDGINGVSRVSCGASCVLLGAGGCGFLAAFFAGFRRLSWPPWRLLGLLHGGLGLGAAVAWLEPFGLIFLWTWRLLLKSFAAASASGRSSRSPAVTSSIGAMPSTAAQRALIPVVSINGAVWRR
jgi:hypothetical protein